MKDMECPYCGAEWESDGEDYSCVDNDEEYECPECGRIMIMSAETQVNFYSEEAEDYYADRIRLAKKRLSLYEKNRDEAADEQTREYNQRMIDTYYQPEVEKLKAALKRCMEHNQELNDDGEEDDLW